MLSERPTTEADPQLTTDKRCLINTTGKGGAGKSMLAMALEALIRRHRSLSLWDLDVKTGSLSSRFKTTDPLTGVAPEDVTNPRNVAWLDALETDAQDVLWDAPGGKIETLLQTFSGNASRFVDNIVATGRRPVVITVIGRQKASLLSVVENIQLFGTSVDHVIVKNGFWGSAKSFEIFDGMQLKNGLTRFGAIGEAARKVNALSVYLDPLFELTDVALDIEDLSFSAACAEPPPTSLRRNEVWNVIDWLGNFEQRIAGTVIDPRGYVVPEHRRGANV